MNIGSNGKNKKNNHSAIYREFNYFQEIIFMIYLNRDYVERHYFYEKQLHQLRLTIFSKILKHPATHLDIFFEILTSLGNLRYRIKDLSILEVCELELRNISKNLSILLTQKKCSEKNDTNFLNSIHAFESMYRKTLQVVVQEPLDLLIFIQNLFDLHAELRAKK